MIYLLTAIGLTPGDSSVGNSIYYISVRYTTFLFYILTFDTSWKSSFLLTFVLLSNIASSYLQYVQYYEQFMAQLWTESSQDDSRDNSGSQSHQPAVHSYSGEVTVD
jgi:hypothetical protein